MVLVFFLKTEVCGTTVSHNCKLVYLNVLPTPSAPEFYSVYKASVRDPRCNHSYMMGVIANTVAGKWKVSCSCKYFVVC